MHEEAQAAIAARASQCGRYWDRTSDPFRVKEVRYRCANRPSMTLKDGSLKGFVNASRVSVAQVILFRLDTKQKSWLYWYASQTARECFGIMRM